MQQKEFDSLVHQFQFDVVQKERKLEIFDAQKMKIILEFLLEAGMILFVGGVYKPLKWRHFKRIWNLAKLVVKLVVKLIMQQKGAEQAQEDL